MDEIWERAVETALDGEKDHASARTLTLDGAVKCIQGRLPPPSLLEKFQNLQHLSIASIGVSSLEQFPKLLKLERLILSDNRIAGGLEFLVEAGLDSLRDLDLSNNRIQHIEDLAPLAQLKLVSLDLYECPVTRVKDYRSRVFKLIESLKYLDKMDLQEKERPESEEEEEDEEEDEDPGSGEIEEEEEEEDEDPGSGEIDGEDRQFVECNGHGEGVGGVVNVDEEEESEAEEEDGDGSNRVPNGQVRVEHVEEDGGGENDSGEEIDEDEDFNIDDIQDHFVEVHQLVESDDDEEDGIEYDEDDDDEDDDDDDDESDDDDDEMGIGNIAQVEFPFDEPLPDTRGLFIDMSGEIDGHEHGEEDGDGDNNGETGEEEIGIEYDPEFEDDDDDEEEDLGAGYLVQPVSHSEALNAGINGGNNDEEEEEIDDNDSDDAQVLPPSSSNLKRKRDDDGDEQ